MSMKPVRRRIVDLPAAAVVAAAEAAVAAAAVVAAAATSTKQRAAPAARYSYSTHPPLPFTSRLPAPSHRHGGLAVAH